MQNRWFDVPERVRSLAAAALSMSSGLWLTAPGQVVLPELGEGFLDAPGIGGSDALVDPECQLQVRGGLARVAL
jgi:hypothetical protein